MYLFLAYLLFLVAGDRKRTIYENPQDMCPHFFLIWRNVLRLETPPWRRKWQPTPIFWPGKSHGQGSLAGCSTLGHKRVRHKLKTKQQQQRDLLVSLIFYKKKRERNSFKPSPEASPNQASCSLSFSGHHFSETMVLSQPFSSLAV